MNTRITVVEKIVDANDRIAEVNCSLLDSAGVFSLNLLASPGAGKISLIEKTLEVMKGAHRVAVIDGDIATCIDADRAAARLSHGDSLRIFYSCI